MLSMIIPDLDCMKKIDDMIVVVSGGSSYAGDVECMLLFPIRREFLCW